MRSHARVLAFALAAVLGACGDDAADAPAAAPQPDARPDASAAASFDAATAEADMTDDARADASFGFGDQAVTPTSPMPDDAAPAAPPPANWRCEGVLASDDLCDCGCGDTDPACGMRGCTDPGCAAAGCDVCFTADGSARDCAAPGIWTCERELRGDGTCDCGCGAPDPDCALGDGGGGGGGGGGERGEDRGCYLQGCSVPACERCPLEAEGSCAAPTPYTCDVSRVGDGICDCGCGNLDPDCRASSCDAPGCSADGCQRCSDEAGAQQKCAMPANRCDAASFGDGKCDCGCGASDPDCGSGKGCGAAGCQDDACELCHDSAGRVAPCPGSWTCAPERRGDGQHCDCGCGRQDPDCLVTTGGGCAEANCSDDACDVRHDAKGRAIRPASWSCDAARFDALDGCDCGCGATDPDCALGCDEPGCNADGCDRCRRENGEAFECRWQCDAARLGDGTCDCGCGTSDPDCGGSLGCPEPGCYANGCELCEGTSGPLACERGGCPAGFKNDGVCDCGCREVDVDCLTSVACVEPGCAERGCGRCHDADGDTATCSSWTCGLEKQGGGDGCNCGCGAADPDCGVGKGCSGPGCLANGCITCRASDGTPMSCPN